MPIVLQCWLFGKWSTLRSISDQWLNFYRRSHDNYLHHMSVFESCTLSAILKKLKKLENWNDSNSLWKWIRRLKLLISYKSNPTSDSATYLGSRTQSLKFWWLYTCKIWYTLPQKKRNFNFRNLNVDPRPGSVTLGHVHQAREMLQGMGLLTNWYQEHCKNNIWSKFHWPTLLRKRKATSEKGRVYFLPITSSACSMRHP